MDFDLSPVELRIVGSLLEKEVTTPEYYPLSLNALALACNQKSSRDPLLSLDQGTVEHTARQLENKHLVSSDENFRGRVVKFTATIHGRSGDSTLELTSHSVDPGDPASWAIKTEGRERVASVSDLKPTPAK